MVSPTSLGKHPGGRETGVYWTLDSPFIGPLGADWGLGRSKIK